MAMAVNPPARDIPSPVVLGKDYSLVRSPDYHNPIPPRPDNDDASSNATHVSPRSRSELVDRYRQQHHAQIRPMKGPLYVPAVLRPTEKPVRHSPPKDAGEARPGDDSWGTIVGSEEIGAATSSTAAAARTGVATVTPDELNDASKGPVTGLPSTNHWKPDSAVTTCNARLCNARFGFFVRRHHCRRCGNIFCWQHSSNRAPLNQHALFHARGTQSRVCDRCYRCYGEWEVRRSSRTNSQSSGGSHPVHIRVDSVSSAPGEISAELAGLACGASALTADAAVPASDPNAPASENAPPEPFRPKSFVASIPNHWNWSTF